jgi:16S rRNA (guanine527-N7)-methyltransferase
MAHKNKNNWTGFKKKPTGKVHKKPVKIYSIQEANDRMLDFFKNHDFSHITHEQRQQLAHFYSLLMEAQKTNNFTRITDLKDVALKHFIDSMIVAKLTDLQFPLLDMGTGPGFPGIPLKILFPNEKIILAEGVQKRVEFLKTVRDELKLQNLDVVGRNINPHFYLPVKGVITRAVEDASNTIENTKSCLMVGGRIYLMKGPNCEPEIEMIQKQKQHYTLQADIKYMLPATDINRRLLVIEKIKQTPFVDPESEPFYED